MKHRGAEGLWRKLWRFVLATFYAVAGWFHLTTAGPFLKIMPAWVPSPELVVTAREFWFEDVPKHGDRITTQAQNINDLILAVISAPGPLYLARDRAHQEVLQRTVESDLDFIEETEQESSGMVG